MKITKPDSVSCRASNQILVILLSVLLCYLYPKFRKTFGFPGVYGSGATTRTPFLRGVGAGCEESSDFVCATG